MQDQILVMDQIFLFECLGTGDFFIIQSKSTKKYQSLLDSFTDNNLCVGQSVFPPMEPMLTGKTLGKDSRLSIFDVKKKLEPFCFQHFPEVHNHISSGSMF